MQILIPNCIENIFSLIFIEIYCQHFHMALSELNQYTLVLPVEVIHHIMTFILSARTIRMFLSLINLASGATDMITEYAKKPVCM